MSGYQVVIDELRKAGRAAGSAGEQAAAVDLAEAICGVPDALPGSRSGPAAAGTANAWREQIRTWSNDATKLGQAMVASADHYVASDAAARADLHAAAQGGGRPR